VAEERGGIPVVRLVVNGHANVRGIAVGLTETFRPPERRVLASDHGLHREPGEIRWGFHVRALAHDFLRERVPERGP